MRHIGGNDFLNLSPSLRTLFIYSLSRMQLFFSNEMKVTPALDPQVFLKENNVPGQIGPQQIKHVAGFRNLHANAILLVYHSDSKTHGSDRGTIGVNAFDHLIACLP